MGRRRLGAVAVHQRAVGDIVAAVMPIVGFAARFPTPLAVYAESAHQHYKRRTIRVPGQR